jgi:uncharacterized protein YcaQ
MPTVNFGEIFQNLDKLAATADKVTEQLTNPREKELLSAAVAKLKQLRQAAGTVVPEQVQKLRDMSEQTLANAKKELAKAEARLEASRAAAASRAVAVVPPDVTPPAVPIPSVPVPAIDPALGERLRSELLAQLGVPTGAANGTARPGKDIWEDWK